MQHIIRWVSESRADKDIGVAMTFYKVHGGEIRATNGKLTASHPWPDDAEFLVSGLEFERVLARMEGDEPTVTVDALASTVTVRSGRFNATIATLAVETWGYHGVEDAEWRAVPTNFVSVIKSLRAFISDKPAQEWAGCVAIDHGNLYATNNIALAGAACEVGEVQTLLSAPAIDFIMRRVEGLSQWFANDNYIAFRWESGAWMRVQRVEGRFPERAADLVRQAYGLKPSQPITGEFREAFADVAGLAEDTLRIYADHMESKFKRSVVVADVCCEVPPDAECSIWGAAFLAPVISQATHWQPSMWPKPTAFKGESIAGFIVGRKSE